MAATNGKLASCAALELIALPSCDCDVLLVVGGFKVLVVVEKEIPSLTVFLGELEESLGQGLVCNLLVLGLEEGGGACPLGS